MGHGGFAVPDVHAVYRIEAILQPLPKQPVRRQRKPKQSASLPVAIRRPRRPPAPLPLPRPYTRSVVLGVDYPPTRTRVAASPPAPQPIQDHTAAPALCPASATRPVPQPTPVRGTSAVQRGAPAWPAPRGCTAARACHGHGCGYGDRDDGYGYAKAGDTAIAAAAVRVHHGSWGAHVHVDAEEWRAVIVCIFTVIARTGGGWGSFSFSSHRIAYILQTQHTRIHSTRRLGLGS